MKSDQLADGREKVCKSNNYIYIYHINCNLETFISTIN
jgi:hypothetical protein